MSNLFYPTIDLFSYQLKEPLNSDLEEINQNVQNFKVKLPNNVQFDDREEEEYLDLTTPRNPELNPTNKKLEGYYYPVRIHDVYGLQLDCSVNNLTEAQPIESFKSIKEEIDSKFTLDADIGIGQTWLISGWLTDDTDSDSEAIAKSCYKNLFPKESWETNFCGKGTFLSGNLFELCSSKPSFDHHVIIILFPDQKMMEKGADFYTDWMGLFAYRNKISWAYRQSRSIKKALITQYRKVEQNTEIIKDNQDTYQPPHRLLKLCNRIQNPLDQYTIDLFNISFQRQVIEINLANYQTRLELMKQKTVEKIDLDCLDKFVNLTQDKYLLQIDKDLENMQLGLRLLENTINTIRSRIELEKAERDSRFQTLVTILGSGIAGATIIDSKANECIGNADKNISFCQIPLIDSFVFPFIWIGIFALVGWLLKEIIRRI